MSERHDGDDTPQQDSDTRATTASAGDAPADGHQADGQESAGPPLNGGRADGSNAAASKAEVTAPGRTPQLFDALGQWYRARAARAPAPQRFVPLSELTLLVVLAGVAGLLVTLVLTYCVRLPVLPAVLCGVIAFVCTTLFNWILVSTMFLRPGMFTRLAATLPALIVGVVIGSILAASCALYLVPDEIAAEISEARREALVHQFSDIPNLEDRVAQLRKTAESPPRRLVDQDPAVAPLLQRQAEVKRLLGEAEVAYVGELDGSTGTGRSGRGPAATAKRERRDRLSDEDKQIDTQLDNARHTAQETIDKEAGVAATAAKEALVGSSNVEGLTDKLARRKSDSAAAEKVPLEDGLRARFGALVGLLVHRPGTVLPTLLLILVGYTVVHLAPVLFTRDGHGEADQRDDHEVAAAEMRAREQLHTNNVNLGPTSGTEGN